MILVDLYSSPRGLGMIRVKQVADRCLQNSERGPKPDPLTQRPARGVILV